MNARSELQLAIGIVVLLNLGLAFGAVGLFARMGPAIDRILDENATSIVAAERMTRTLAEHQGALSQTVRRELQGNLAILTTNVTEPEEVEVIDRLTAHLASVDRLEMRSRMLEDLVQIAEINHAAMDRAGATASRIGNAGAWAAVWVGLVSLGLTLVVLSRLRQRLINPLEEVAAVIRATRKSDNGRRCQSSDAPPQLQALMEDLNALLDQRAEQHRIATPSKREQHLRQIAQAMLEQLPRPAAVCDDKGSVLFANLAMLDALAADDGPQLRAVLGGSEEAPAPEDKRLQRTPLKQDVAVLWQLVAEADG